MLSQRQITHFNSNVVAEMLLGRPRNIVYVGKKGEDVQTWLNFPAGCLKEDGCKGSEDDGGGVKKFPLAVCVREETIASDRAHSASMEGQNLGLVEDLLSYSISDAEANLTVKDVEDSFTVPNS